MLRWLLVLRIVSAVIAPGHLGQEPLVALDVRIGCQRMADDYVLGIPILAGKQNIINLADAPGVARIDECLSPEVFAAISTPQFGVLLANY